MVRYLVSAAMVGVVVAVTAQRPQGGVQKQAPAGITRGFVNRAPGGVGPSRSFSGNVQARPFQGAFQSRSYSPIGVRPSYSLPQNRPNNAWPPQTRVYSPPYIQSNRVLPQARVNSPAQPAPFSGSGTVNRFTPAARYRSWPQYGIRQGSSNQPRPTNRAATPLPVPGAHYGTWTQPNPQMQTWSIPPNAGNRSLRRQPSSYSGVAPSGNAGFTRESQSRIRNHANRHQQYTSDYRVHSRRTQEQLKAAQGNALQNRKRTNYTAEYNKGEPRSDRTRRAPDQGNLTGVKGANRLQATPYVPQGVPPGGQGQAPVGREEKQTKLQNTIPQGNKALINPYHRGLGGRAGKSPSDLGNLPGTGQKQSGGLPGQTTPQNSKASLPPANVPSNVRPTTIQSLQGRRQAVRLPRADVKDWVRHLPGQTPGPTPVPKPPHVTPTPADWHPPQHWHAYPGWRPREGWRPPLGWAPAEGWCAPPGWYPPQDWNDRLCNWGWSYLPDVGWSVPDNWVLPSDFEIPPGWYYMPESAYAQYGLYDPYVISVTPGQARPDLMESIDTTVNFVPPEAPAVVEQEKTPPERPVPAPVPAVVRISSSQQVTEALTRKRVVPNPGDKSSSGSAIRYEGPVLCTYSIQFEPDSYAILPDSFPALDAIGQALIKPPLNAAIISIEGHTDIVGKPDYNLRLSERRAWSVKSYLVEKFGIDPKRLITIGYGDKAPIASNETEKGRALNRRVEFENVTDLYKVNLKPAGSASTQENTTSETEIQQNDQTGTNNQDQVTTSPE